MDLGHGKRMKRREEIFGEENYGDGGRIINKCALKAHGSGNHTL